MLSPVARGLHDYLIDNVWTLDDSDASISTTLISGSMSYEGDNNQAWQALEESNMTVRSPEKGVRIATS